MAIPWNMHGTLGTVDETVRISAPAMAEFGRTRALFMLTWINTVALLLCRTAAAAVKNGSSAEHDEDEAALLEGNGAPEMPTKRTNGVARTSSDAASPLERTPSEAAQKETTGLVGGLLSSPLARCDHVL